MRLGVGDWASSLSRKEDSSSVEKSKGTPSLIDRRQEGVTDDGVGKPGDPIEEKLEPRLNPSNELERPTETRCFTAFKPW